MIRLGLRLTLGGGREAAVRLITIALAVSLGVGMFLIALAGINAVNTQNGRYAWLESGSESALSSPTTRASTTDGAGSSDPFWWLLSADEFRGTVIGRVDVATTGPDSPVLPGIPAPPGPGQFYASPAMTSLLRSTPATELADRYPGAEIGTIGDAALPAPSSLLIVVGRTAHQLAHVPGAAKVATIDTRPPSACNGACYSVGINASGIDLILAVAAAALLFPVLIFIGTATRLSASRREQRFAAMRLVGATPRQISMISAVESTVASLAGVALGFLWFALLRPSIASIPFTGAPFFSRDLSLHLVDVLGAAVGVPIAAAIAARLALRRVQISPLGVTRRVTPRAPRAYRVIPLLLGIIELAYFVYAGRPSTSAGQTRAYLPGILLVMTGLIVAGPWLTMAGARLMARRANRPAVLIAARRLADNPQAGFRAISGLVIALFVTSVAIGVITTIDSYSGGTNSGAAANDTVVEQFTDFSEAGPPSTSVLAVPTPLLARLRSIRGVTAVTLVHTDPFTSRGDLGPPPSLVSCANLAGTPAFGHCPAGAVAARITPEFGGRRFTQSATVWPAAVVSTATLNRLPVQSVVVATKGSSRAIETARTDLEVAYPYVYSANTITEDIAQNPSVQLDSQYQRLVDVVILTSLPIAGCSLAVSIAAGLSDRKRPFSLLRLSGAPLSMLRRVIAIESAVPLLTAAVVAIGAGFLAAGLFLTSQLHETLQPPHVAYYLVISAGLLASLAVIGSTLPLLERLTGPEIARNE